MGDCKIKIIMNIRKIMNISNTMKYVERYKASGEKLLINKK